ncbi:MAG: YjgP/YjgQ family permease [bacterium]|nr:YjgP/YjgQ family permease [bacterium]
MFLIYRHLMKTAAGPFFFGLFVITFLLMIQILYKFVDLFVGKGVSAWIALKVLILSLGHTFALSVPMAVLISILMAVGQLANDSEITAMKANGISLWAVLRPLLLLAGIIGLGLAAYNHFIFPNSNHELANLIYDINRQKPMMEIQEGQFTEMGDKMTIYVKSKDDLTGRIEDVSIFEKEKPGDLSPRLTTATWGMIIPEHVTDSLLMELYDGEIHERPEKEDPTKYRVTRFTQHNMRIANVERDFKESGRKAKSDREMDMRELWGAAHRESGRQTEVNERVIVLSENLLQWQFQLLDESRRDDVLGRQLPAKDSRRRSKLQDGKLRSLPMKVDRLIDQAGYQGKIAESYKIKSNRFLVEFHKKLAIPFACLVFALLGVPLAVTSSRSGKGVSVSLALAVYLIYYLFLVGGEKFADRGKMDPLLAMWSANIVLLAIGIPIFIKTAREGQIFNFQLPAIFNRKSSRSQAKELPH